MSGLLYVIASLWSDRVRILNNIKSIDFTYQFHQYLLSLKSLGLINCITLIVALTTVLYLGKINLYLVLKIAPGNWDSMTYHLARMAYYIQQGNLDSFNADYWAQVVHPKNATILMIFSFLGSGRNENWTQLVQYLSYWLAMLSIYGIGRILSMGRASSLFSALIFGLLTTSLMEASTTQNDLLIAALIGCSLYGLLVWGINRRVSYLLLCILSISIAIGVKGAALLVLPSLLLIALFLSFIHNRPKQHQSKDNRIYSSLQIALQPLNDAPSKRGALTMAATISIFSLFTLPAGYLENWKLYHHPIGPESIRKIHSFEGSSPSLLLENGLKNGLRYSLEFLSLDGFKNENATTLQLSARQGFQSAFNWIGLDLEKEKNVRQPFQYSRPPISHEDKSYWGVLGFLIIWQIKSQP
jgi:hypothetical protein